MLTGKLMHPVQEIEDPLEEQKVNMHTPRESCQCHASTAVTTSSSVESLVTTSSLGVFSSMFS